MIPTISTTTDVATIRAPMTNENEARQQQQQHHQQHQHQHQQQGQYDEKFQNSNISTVTKQSISSQLLQTQQEQEQQLLQQQHESQSPDTILMFPTTTTNSTTSTATTASSTCVVTSHNTLLILSSSTNTNTNPSNNDKNTSTGITTGSSYTTTSVIDPIDDPNVDHSELVAQLELQVQLLQQQQQLEEEDGDDDNNGNDNNCNNIHDDDNDDINNNNNNVGSINSNVDLTNVQQRNYTYDKKENDSRITTVSTCTGSNKVFSTSTTRTGSSTIPNTFFRSSGIPTSTTTGTSSNNSGSNNSFVKRSSSLTSLNSSSSYNNLFQHRRLPSVIDEGTDCYNDTTTTCTITIAGIDIDNNEVTTGTNACFVSSETERIPLITTTRNSRNNISNNNNNNNSTDYEYSYDQIEQEESQKYSGMDVLRRITSSQKDLFLSFDNTNNDNNNITDSSNTATYNHQEQQLYQQDATERRNNNGIDNDDDDDDDDWLQQQENIGNRKDHHHHDTITTGSCNDMRQQQQQQYQHQHDQVVVALEKMITNVDTCSVPTSADTTIHSSIVFDKVTNVFIPYYTITYYLNNISNIIHLPNYDKVSAVTWISFYALLVVTCSNNILSPMRDAIALHVGVTMIPLLTLCSTILALFSSVPIGWLFEAPDPSRRIVWKQLGLTRGETQGTSLALFYRLFALLLILYSIAFCIVDWIVQHYRTISTTINGSNNNNEHDIERRVNEFGMLSNTSTTTTTALSMWLFIDQALYITFFLLVHLMKLHCLSLVWGVATEALEYEEEGRLTSPETVTTSRTSTTKEAVTSSSSENDNTDTGSGDNANNTGNNQKRRIKCLAFIGFGGTVGGIVGSIIASTMAKLVRLSGLLILSAILLEIGAQLSIELGRIMQKHWIDQRMVYLEKVQYQQQQQEQLQKQRLQQYEHHDDTTNQCHLSRNQSSAGYEINTNDSTNNINNNNIGGGFDSSMKRSVSLGSMKRVASGNSLHRVNSGASLSRIRSTSDVGTTVTDDDNVSTTSRSSVNVTTTTTLESVGNDFIVQSNNDTGIRRRRQIGNDYEESHTTATTMEKESTKSVSSNSTNQPNTINNITVDDIEEQEDEVNDSSFVQRLLRGMYTIFRSRLLMAIFTYNALYASTTVLLSFQRAALIADRNNHTNNNTTVGSGVGSVNADTSFLANINMASSIAIFALQASGAGAYVAHLCGPRGTLSLMPIIRLLGVIALAYWHHTSNGQPPNLIYFLIVDEFCKVMNLAIAKPVRESLWRGLSNEARYEAKPIVDTLANRWGGGSAAFLVTFVDRTVRAMNTVAKYHNQNNDSSSNNKMEQQSTMSITDDNNEPVQVFGFPTIVFLCIIISAWWVVVSADLGFIRKNIDIDLKKRQ